MEKKLYICILSFILIACSCSKTNKNLGFFAWMDAYIAIEKDETNSIAITLFFEDKPFSKDDISSIALLDIENDVEVTKFNIEYSDEEKQYSSYIITLEYLAKSIGVYNTTGVEIELLTGENITYPIGLWTFDVDESSFGAVDSWRSPAVSSNGNEFPYDYSMELSNYKIQKIYFGENLYEDGKNVKNKGIITLEEYYSAPIVYIKSKIIVSESDVNIIDYGKGCYCGALDFNEEDMELSRKQNEIN